MRTQNLLPKMPNKDFGKHLLFTLCLLLGSYTYAQTPSVTVTVVQQPCNGDGVLAVNVISGMTAPITYTYFDYSNSSITHTGSLNDTLFGISWPIYYVTLQDVNGITYSNFNVGMFSPFQTDAPTVTNAICPSITGTAQITINQGTLPASVQWINGWTGTVMATGNPVNLPPGYYNTVITDANGCIAKDSGNTWIEHISPITFTINTTVASCSNGTATVANPAGGNAPYTYQWSNGSNNSSIGNLTLGWGTVTVTDAQGCYTSDNYEISQSVAINVNSTPTAATCAQNNGSVIAFGSGGTPPYTYQYSNGMSGQSISGIAGSTYLTINVTDANGCIGSGSAYISTFSPVNVTYSVTSSSCTAPTGSATLSINGGTAPYSVSWNTFPVQTGTSISNMAAGSYSFTVTDAAGCVRSGLAVIPQQSVINAQAYSSNPACPATTGLVSVSVSGTNPPYTYTWNTGATTASLSAVALGNYTCVITDNVGCSLTKAVTLQSSSPVSISLSTTDASCLYTADGSVMANPVGGTAPYTYQWSNGQNTATATGLSTGHLYLYVTDANGCTQDKHTFVGYDAGNNNCYCTITGKVYLDMNNNCQFDSGEQGVENIMINGSGLGAVFTNANGDYSFAAPSGTYTLSESVQSIYPLAGCQNNAVSVTVTAAPGCVSTTNFANAVNPIHDIHIVKTNVTFAIPGNTYTQAMIVQNDGTIGESAILLGSEHDGQLGYVSATPAMYTQQDAINEPNWYSVTSGLSLAPGAATVIYTDYMVPPNIPLATEVNFWDSAAYAAPMTNWLSDYTPWNNVETLSTTVIGSYDPNFKEVSPKGTGAQGYIATTDSVLDYIVHFQNTGSYYAQKVVILDTLDADLDWTSLRPGYSDHNYVATISETGVLKFTFNNINLPWQDMTEMGSRGMVAYSIKQKPNLSPGTEMRNSAAIYFDYNEPVITNQTLNTIELPAGISEMKPVVGLNMYPNPTTNELNINLVNADNSSIINVFDVQGRLLHSQQVNGNAVQKVDVSGLTSGFYFVSVESNNGLKVTGKFLKN